jgi:hypothetical protein
MFEIGSSLREARLRKGLDFPEVEYATKVRAKYLRALEDEQFDVLPGQTYVKGFLHSYAEYLGLDGQLYVDEYTSRFWVDEESGNRAARRVRVRRRNHRKFERNMIILTLVAIGVVTALVIAAWRFGSGGDGSSAQPPAHRLAKQAPAPKRQQSSFVVRAVAGSSLVEVHAGGPAGKLVYHGTIEAGETQRFSQRWLWLNVSSPEHLVFTFRGRTVEYAGKCPRVLTVTPKQVTSTASCS